MKSWAGTRQPLTHLKRRIRLRFDRRHPLEAGCTVNIIFDKESAIPYYIQVKEGVKTLISSGELKPVLDTLRRLRAHVGIAVAPADVIDEEFDDAALRPGKN